MPPFIYRFSVTFRQVPFAISWPDFLKRLRDEFPGVCGCTYVHNDSVAVISNFRQFEQAFERVEDAFIAGSSDGSLEILVRLFDMICAHKNVMRCQVIDDAAALATISGAIPKHSSISSAVADSAVSSHRPQSGTRACISVDAGNLMRFTTQLRLDLDRHLAVRSRQHLGGQTPLHDRSLWYKTCPSKNKRAHQGLQAHVCLKWNLRRYPSQNMFRFDSIISVCLLSRLTLAVSGGFRKRRRAGKFRSRQMIFDVIFDE
jgi:hypothetical protein